MIEINDRIKSRIGRGIVESINTCIVGCGDCTGEGAINDVVWVGILGLMGEIIELEDQGKRIKVLMHDSVHGLAIGEPVILTGEPLCVELGPGILNNVFDGLQRPLVKIADFKSKDGTDNTSVMGLEIDGYYELDKLRVPRGTRVLPHSLDRVKLWMFETSNKYVAGDLVSGGDVIGTVRETDKVVHTISVPPNVRGWVVDIAASGQYNIEHPLMVIEDEHGDGELIVVKMLQKWPIRTARPTSDRLPLVSPQMTGQRVLDSFFPLAQGGIAVIPGYKGLGKTMITHSMSVNKQQDILVYVHCGERGNETCELLMELPEVCERDPEAPQPFDWRTATSVMERTCVIANTTAMSPGSKQASIYTGVSICEYFRDMGYNVTMIADSMTRWADAVSEISQCKGEMLLADNLNPSHLTSQLTSFYSRAGRVSCLEPTKTGSISMLVTLSPRNGEMETDPTSKTTLRQPCSLWSLQAHFHRIKHFPAVSWTDSHSDYIINLKPYYDSSVGEQYTTLVETAKGILAREFELADSVKRIGKDQLPCRDQVTLEVARMLREDFLQQNLFTPYDRYCPLYKTNFMLSNFILFYNLANKALKENAPKLKWTNLRKENNDVLYKLSSMKFQYIQDGRETFDQHFKDLESTIKKSFTHHFKYSH